jgi:acyl-CoA dehydrogenase
LKFEEMTSGRFADAFGTLYLGYSCLWYYTQHKEVEGIDTLFELSMENLLKDNQAALSGIAENFPISTVGTIMGLLNFPTGHPYNGPSDVLVQKAARLVSTPSGVRDLLSEGVFISNDPSDHLRMLNDILPKSVKVDEILAAAKKEKRALTVEEQGLVDEVVRAADVLVQVDSFDRIGAEKNEGADYVRPALRNTRFEHLDVAKTPASVVCTV